MRTYLKLTLAACIAILSAQDHARAQWKTETFTAKEKWSAFFPLVDASDLTLDDIFASYPDVKQVWRWNPDAGDTYVLDGRPVQGADWSVWKKGFPADSTMTRLLPNHGYLIKVKNGAGDVTFTIKGKAVMPEVTWRNDGLNLVGFPAATSPAPTIENYLAASGQTGFNTEVRRYIGGVNPLQANLSVDPLNRGQAYWISTRRYSDYYGPIKVQVSLSADGMHYGEQGTALRVLLTNRTDQEQTVTLTPESSETDRNGTAVSPVPLLERVFDDDTQNFTFPSFDGPQTLTIAPGETIGKVVALDRGAMTGAPGTIFGSLLTVTDGQGLSRIHVPVSATVSGLGGLWVGEARINRVRNQLQEYLRDGNGNYVYDDVGNRTLIGGDIELNATAQTFPIRLLVHLDGTGNARLLSTVYAGVIDSTNTFGIATAQSALDPGYLADAMRLTSVHFPLDLDLGLTGSFAPSSTLGGTVTLNHDDAVSPFVHTYHPDHDNLDARFENNLVSGFESYDVQRALTLTFDADDSASPDPSWGANVITGTYSETITGIHKETLDVEGPFRLRRLSEIDVIHAPTPTP